MTGRDASILDWRGHHVLTLLSRLILGLVFIGAAIHKIVHPAEFAMTVATYQILPLELVNLQAIGLPWLEAVVGGLLIAGLWTRESALLTVGMNLMFVLAILVTLHRGDQIACGCFASEEAGHQIGWDLVVRDVGLLLMGTYLTLAGPRMLSLDRLLGARRKVSDEKN